MSVHRSEASVNWDKPRRLRANIPSRIPVFVERVWGSRDTAFVNPFLRGRDFNGRWVAKGVLMGRGDVVDCWF